MTDPDIAIFSSPHSHRLGEPPTPTANRPHKPMRVEILQQLLRLSAPNVLNLLAIAGMITFNGVLGRLRVRMYSGCVACLPLVMLIQHTAASGCGWGRLVRDCTRARTGKQDVATVALQHFRSGPCLAAVFSTVLLLAPPFIFDGWVGMAKY